MLRGRPDRRARRLLLVRHQRPDPDRARLLARRRRGRSSCPLHGAQDHRPLPVRDDRQAGRGLARAAGGVGRARGASRTSSSASAASTAATRTRSTSSTWPGSTTCAARRTACRSRASRPRRPQFAKQLRNDSAPRAGLAAPLGRTRGRDHLVRVLRRAPAGVGGRAALAARRPLLSGRRARAGGRLRRCARRSSATATGSSTARRSGGSSTRRRCSSRPRATTTARG